RHRDDLLDREPERHHLGDRAPEGVGEVSRAPGIALLAVDLVMRITADDVRPETRVETSPGRFQVEMRAVREIEEHTALVRVPHLGLHLAVLVEEAPG